MRSARSAGLPRALGDLAAEFRALRPASAERRSNQGIDLRRFRRRPRPSSTLRVGFAGGLIPSKAPHVLLAAIGKLPAATVCVDLSGSVASITAARNTPRRRPVAEASGHPPARSGATRADGGGASSRSTSSSCRRSGASAPFTIREAFAAARPVVASDFGGWRKWSATRSTACSSRWRRDASPSCLRRSSRSIARRRPAPALTLDVDREDIARRLRELYAEHRAAGRGKPGPRRPRKPAPSGQPASFGNRRRGNRRRLGTVGAGLPGPPGAGLLHRAGTTDAGSDSSCGAFVLQTSLPRSGSRHCRRQRSRRRSSVRCGARSRIDVIDSPANLGFSAAAISNPVGARARRAECVLLVNSDVVLGPDALGRR